MNGERELFRRVFLALQGRGRQDITDVQPAPGDLWRSLAGRDVTEVELERELANDAIDFGPRWIPLPLDESKAWRPILWLAVNFQTNVASFQVVLMNRDDADIALGFRFETPSGLDQGAVPGIHHFHHMQFLTDVRPFGAIHGIPAWLPTSIPTFPLEANSPVALAFCLLLSIYGFGFERTLIPEAALQRQLGEHYGAMTCVGPLPAREAIRVEAARKGRQKRKRQRRRRR